MDPHGRSNLAHPDGNRRAMPMKDVWLRVFWKWSRRGIDRSYAAWMADQAEKRIGAKSNANKR